MGPQATKKHIYTFNSERRVCMQKLTTVCKGFVSFGWYIPHVGLGPDHNFSLIIFDPKRVTQYNFFDLCFLPLSMSY